MIWFSLYVWRWLISWLFSINITMLILDKIWLDKYIRCIFLEFDPFFIVCQVWLFLLIILASSKQVLSSAEAKREGEEIGTCRFDLTSVATLSCVEPDGNWRPPSVSCCEALLYAIDNLPARNESGACCLCRYLSKKYSSHGLALATSYVLCQGKDSHIVTAWSSLAHNCYRGTHFYSVFYWSLKSC